MENIQRFIFLTTDSEREHIFQQNDILRKLTYSSLPDLRTITTIKMIG